MAMGQYQKDLLGQFAGISNENKKLHAQLETQVGKELRACNVGFKAPVGWLPSMRSSGATARLYPEPRAQGSKFRVSSRERMLQCCV